MAHGGHSSCGGGHYHSHSNSRSGGNPIIPFVLLIVIIIIYAIMKPDIRGRQPLEGEYELYPEFILDEKGYFSDSEELISGLEYFYKKTNVQIVVMSAKGKWSDKKVVDKYYELFSDEAHVLIVCPTSWYEKNIYYAIGDLANKVVDDDVMDVLLRKVIKKQKNGKRWRKNLTFIADTILQPK